MQAIVNAAQMIQLGEASVVLAGGMEAMSQAPFSIRGRDGFSLAPGGKLEDSLMVALLDTFCGSYMANTAELYGEQQGITRQAQDEFALRSQQAADAAYKEASLAGRTGPGAAQESQRRADRRKPDRRRSSPSANNHGRPGQTEARIRQERHRYRRQRQWHRGWRSARSWSCRSKRPRNVASNLWAAS